MATPLAPEVLEADEATIRALHELPDYAPVNPAHSLNAAMDLDEEAAQAIATVARIRNELAIARDIAIAVTRKRHEVVVGIRAAVKLQYGSDSTAVKVIGLKKKSDYKRPKRRKFVIERAAL